MKPLIAGNWKMHLNRGQAADLAGGVAQKVEGFLDRVDVALFPPFTALEAAMAALGGREIALGAQDVHEEDAGAYTGSISAPMLLDLGCTQVLAGHSERRHGLGEDDGQVNRKFQAALRHDMAPILCVGETLEQRESDRTAEVVRTQVRAGLEGVGAASTHAVTVAYEPVWAIGTGQVASPDQACEVHRWIREELDALFGAAAAEIRILYGGSVKPGNAQELLAREEIQGALVGGACLEADSFAAIVRAACP